MSFGNRATLIQFEEMSDERTDHRQLVAILFTDMVGYSLRTQNAERRSVDARGLAA